MMMITELNYFRTERDRILRQAQLNEAMKENGSKPL
jgi:hypothetical protein